MSDLDTVDGLQSQRCVNHPERETLVRCSSCGDPICTDCMVFSPVGVKCRRCAKLPRSALVTLKGHRAVKAAAAGILAGAGVGFVYYFLLGALGFFFLSFVLAAGAGVAVGEVVFRASGAYRGRATAVIAACCTVWAFMFPLLVSTIANFGLSWRVVVLSLTGRSVLHWILMAVGVFFAWRRNR